MQNTDQILMIRPITFQYNAQTAVNNLFQVKQNDQDKVQVRALAEFDNMVGLLRDNGVSVLVINDTPDPETPDSIFPNNWISFHGDTVMLYPMFAENRRHERKQHVIDKIEEIYFVKKIIDMTLYEEQNMFLEGTGSMVLDRNKKIAYAALSSRTDLKLLSHFSKKMHYQPVAFYSHDDNEIYHTNVIMSVGDKYAVVCMDVIEKEQERNLVKSVLKHSDKEIIEISVEQMNSFAGNMLQVKNNKDEKLLVMSTQAYESLTPEQIQKLEKYNRILHSDLRTIETNGGGSARCMMAEIFLEKRH